MYIALEGGEGTGKSVQIILLANILEDMGYKVVVTKEPGGTPIGEKIRDILLDSENTELTGLAEAFLFSADRAQLIAEVIRPAILGGSVVLTDRSCFSTEVYQGFARGEDITNLRSLRKIAVGETLPDYVILLDLDPEIGLLRKRAQEEHNRLDAEAIEFHRKVREGFLSLAEADSLRVYTTDYRWYVIDASLSIEKIHQQIVAFVLNKLHAK